ncbi:hypothetical protein IFM89_012358 [Coptis chinensis]|uniref:TF-B3 domain-containing protein n=1 Tax=Coptis chinensis TaxID=261450 RepID=A0A835I1W0_9MAGN|nr:hypothetical protein IFM89_012358 [Coptis chinensis]
MRYLVGEKLDDQATLRTKRGGNESWTVSVKGSRFKDGWEDFARAHDLCIGDFLVFKHEGGLMFHVHIFDPTACEKVYPLFDVAKDDQKMGKANTNEKKKNVGKAFLSFKGNAMVKPVEDPQFKITMKTSHFKWWTVCIPADFGRENGLGKRREMMTLEDPKGRSWEVQLSHRRTGHAYIPSGWRAFSMANKLGVGDICTFKLVSRMDNKVAMKVSVSRSKSSV